MSYVPKTFEAWLTLACLITGVVWVIDRLVLRRRRAAEQKPNWAIDFARSFFPVLLAVLVLRTFVFEPFRIPSRSMVPTLLVGDFVLVEKFSYGLRLPVTHTKIVATGEPERGDVMVFRYPPKPRENYIKRVIGLPGDKIAYRNEQLYVNGKPVPRTELGVYRGADASVLRTMTLFAEALPGANSKHRMLHIRGRYGPRFSATVPAGQYFVMGDNRDDSSDSRVWGFVPEHNLVGRAFLIWFSIDWTDFDVRFSRLGTLLE